MSLLGWLTLSLTDGLGPVLSGRLVEAIGNVDAAMTATPAMLRGIEGIGQTKASTIAASLGAARDEAKRELDRVAAADGVRLVCLDDEDYPALMRSIHTPPMVLYVRGTLEPRDLHAVAIVGSRKCSLYGREQAERLGYGLANVGACVISGGARGIDTAAHVGALNAKNGRTIAVLGCGVDRVYPPENKALFERICADANGAIVSEFPLGTPPVADNFPRRNRIISAMSRGVIVVEAEEKSGALITVKYATEHDRTVFAVPGRVDNPLSAGPHRLIRDGAVLVERVSDVLENLGSVQVLEHAAEPASLPVEEATLFVDAPPAPKPAFAPTERQQLILDAIGADVVGVDAICDRAALPVSQVMGEMTMLTLRGAVKRVDGDRYAVKSPAR